MSTQIIKTLSIAMAAILAGAVTYDVSANHGSESLGQGQLVYQSKSINHNIFSYLSKIVGEKSDRPMLIYVSQAYGPSIYSYGHSNPELPVPFNITYVNTAYSPAIYSYPTVATEVELMPVEFVD